jgi:hypothetical protein
MAEREGHLRRARSHVRRQQAQRATSFTAGQPGRGLLELQKVAGNAATRQAVQQHLDPAVRGQLERRFGVDLRSVRVHNDGVGAANAGGIAHTVGDHITVDPGRYRPGTFTGDLLIAHEVAHVVQQRDGGSGTHTSDEPALEADADRAALSAVTGQPATGFLPTLRSALSLRRCKGCTKEEEDWLERFRAETDPERLAAMLRHLSAEQFRRLKEAPDGGDQAHRDAVSWEEAWRNKAYDRMRELSDRTDPKFRTTYAQQLVETIMAGGVTIQVTGGDGDFRSFVEGALTDLSRTPHGMGLLLDLLASGKQVDLAPATAGSGHETRPASDTAARLATQVPESRDPSTGQALPPEQQPANVGAPLPPSEQRRGAGSGSTVSLDMSMIHNQVTLGGTAAQPTIIEMPPSMTVGHELIHALHNARGINIGMGVAGSKTDLADPVTGQAASPEELYTITGQTHFTRVPGSDPDRASQPTDYDVPRTVTENDLRADVGLDRRASHPGAIATTAIPRGTSTTVDAVVARYRLAGRPVPPEVAATIRRMLTERGLTDQALAQWQMPTVQVPHPDHVRLRVEYVERNRRLANSLRDLTVQ